MAEVGLRWKCCGEPVLRQDHAGLVPVLCGDHAPGCTREPQESVAPPRPTHRTGIWVSPEFERRAAQLADAVTTYEYRDDTAARMSDERLADIETDHIGYLDDLSEVWQERCSVDNEDAPCLVSRLVAEIRRLRRENQLLKLSQGDLGAVGQD